MSTPAFAPCRALTAAAVLLFTLPSVRAQAPHPLTPAEHQRVDELIHKMTLDQKLDYIGGTGFGVRAVPALGLPAFAMSDGPYGTRSNAGFPSTAYAAGIALAATWDRELAERVGGGIGRDARARGVHFMLGPGVNIYRSPLNGRNFEYFGEDPFLAGQIAVGYIEGMQQQGVSATVKHFAANNSEYLRHDSNSIVDERALREIYLPSFEAAVKQAHVGAIMDSYNLINGVHATQNTHLNTEIVRNEWLFPGVLMSDWDATYDGVGAANGGLDIEMPTGKFMNRADLLPAIKTGTLSEATIDEKVRHILTTAMAFSWIDAEGNARNQQELAVSAYDARNNAVALESARESIVLLKNEHKTLPLEKAALKTVLAVGPDAYPGFPGGGGSSGVKPFHTVSLLEGLSAELGPQVNVLYARGVPAVEALARKTDFTTTAGGNVKGLIKETYSNTELTGKPVTTTVIPHLNLTEVDWTSLNDNVEAVMGEFSNKVSNGSRRFTGFYNAAQPGRYLLVVEGAGEGAGNRVYVDGKLIFDNWTELRAFQPWTTLELSAGPHKLVVEDMQSGPFSGHMRVAIVPAETIVDPQAVALARLADAVVVAAGYSTSAESEGGDRTFALPYGQDALIVAMAAANRKTIVDVTSGGNVDSSLWIDKVPAYLESWYGGQAGGTALAEVLTGKSNPSGHLPVTFERRAEDNPTYNNYYPAKGSIDVHYNEGIFVGYRGYEKAHTQPLFPFGYGLSYTTFKFSKLTVTPELNGTEPHVTVAFDVTDTGKLSGAEVAQVYVSDGHSPVERPAHELKGFERVQLAPGQTKRVTVKLDPRAFAYYDVTAKKWTIAPGKFGIHVGDSVASLALDGEVTIDAAVAAKSF